MDRELESLARRCEEPPMTHTELVERLRAIEHTSPDSVGISTHWHRNPDGPAAADFIESQSKEIARLREALEWPKLTRAMIEAAADAHYGKQRVARSGGPDGITMTVENRDWSFTDMMRRIWPAMRRAARG